MKLTNNKFNTNRRICILTSWLKRHLLLILIVPFLSLSACKKMIEVDLPIDKNTAEEVYNNPLLASHAMLSVYAALAESNTYAGSCFGMSVRSASLADEIFQEGFKDEVQLNNLDGNSSIDIWTRAYKNVIYPVNSLIEGVEDSKDIPGEIKKILIGEAKFARAWMYFYLVNYYGDVPLVITTSFRTNSNISRTPVNEIYEQIISDLQEAQVNLPENYFKIDLLTPDENRIRPNKSAVTALLARVYLYTKDWARAEAEATKVIQNNAMYDTVPLNEVFLKNNKEAIWQLQPNTLDFDGNINTGEGRVFIPSTSRFPNLLYSVSSFLKNDFEANDNRRTIWITTVNVAGSDYEIPYKYKVGNRDGGPTQEQNEYVVVLRLAEQYLIRAEARAFQNNLIGTNSAASDIDVIRKRAGLSNTTASTQSEMLSAIFKERRLELFTEFGHRWLDLKRSSEIDEVMNIVAPIKGGTWAVYKALLPIPYSEFKYNPSLIGHQNPGYSEQ